MNDCINEKYRKGQLIKCNDDEEVRRIFKELGKIEGLHAVRVWKNWIRITEVRYGKN